MSLEASEQKSDQEPIFSVIEGGNSLNNEASLKCFQSELQSVRNMTVSELFSGFDTIHAITFSYDIDFIDKLLYQFKYAEITFGADFLVEKDTKLNTVLIDAIDTFSGSSYTLEQIRSHGHLVKMLQDGDIAFRTPSFVMDHRKIYLLSSDDGKHTRVIIASANMSGRAWNGDHMEFYSYDNSEYCYKEYMADFETAWRESINIPYDIVSVKKDDIINDNPFIRQIQETDKAVVLQHDSEQIIENVKRVIDFNKFQEQFKELLSDVKMKEKNGVVEITSKIIEKMNINRKKSEQKKASVQEVIKNYPTLVIDYGNDEALLDDKPMNLHPTEDEIRNDIDALLEVFDNFNGFLGDSEKMKKIHFKIMNAIFVSPFNAKFRCAAQLKDRDADLPLFMLVSSSTANTGKTFMISLALKMMTGCNVPVYNKEKMSIDKIRVAQVGCKGIPVFIDELDSGSMQYLKGMLKYPQICEDNQIDTMPMLIFASNDITDPEDWARKRVIFFKLNGCLPSDVDQCAYKNVGRSLKRKFGTGFYREYLRRMIKKASEEMDYMMTAKDISDTYYPDLTKLSSETIISILEDYGYEIPVYMNVLTWNNDYGPEAKYIHEEAFSDICELYDKNKKVFTITKDNIIMEFDNTTDNKKTCKSWANTLPREVEAKLTTTRYNIQFTLNRNEFEKRSGKKFRKPIIRR